MRVEEESAPLDKCWGSLTHRTKQPDLKLKRGVNFCFTRLKKNEVERNSMKCNLIVQLGQHISETCQHKGIKIQLKLNSFMLTLPEKISLGSNEKMEAVGRTNLKLQIVCIVCIDREQFYLVS